MIPWAKYTNGVEVSDSVFRLLARCAPSGTLDVFASDQHSSYLKLTDMYLHHVGAHRRAHDDDVRTVCRVFAETLGGLSTAGLFNHLAYKSPGFRELLGRNVLLIGRLEDTQSEVVDGGRGQLARLAIPPEEANHYVDGFKTLVKLDPDHKSSWEHNLGWLKDIYDRCRKLGKPLFSETLLFQRPGEAKTSFAQRLPEELVQLAATFAAHGDFYKTQVPLLWVEDGGRIAPISRTAEIRACAQKMAAACDRPMLLLSAAVDFSQYSAQYALVSDIFAGPMCGRAYFKEAFTDQATTSMGTLGQSFARIALPRIRQIQELAKAVSPPWWSKYVWIAEEAKTLIDERYPHVQA